MKRHNARILTVMVLYNLDMNQHLNEEILEEIVNETKQEVFDLILDEEYKVEVDYEFMEKLLDITIKNYGTADNPQSNVSIQRANCVTISNSAISIVLLYSASVI